jgi:dolichol-phosphate mannosyltransferase
MLSIVIPAYNESENLPKTLGAVYQKLKKEKILHEIIVINDNSNDDTLKVLQKLKTKINTLEFFTNKGPNGFGFAIKYGLERFKGDYVAIMMADLSDSPDDLVKFYRVIKKENVDCVFGSRFITGGKTYDYPKFKLLINRVVNNFIKILFNIKYNDATNAFKMYKKETIYGLKPIISHHFNLTIELSLKSIIRGYSYSVIPNEWRNREKGVSNLKLKEMGSRYFFVLIYCLIEKYFSMGDYLKK